MSNGAFGQPKTVTPQPVIEIKLRLENGKLSMTGSFADKMLCIKMIGAFLDFLAGFDPSSLVLPNKDIVGADGR